MALPINVRHSEPDDAAGGDSGNINSLGQLLSYSPTDRCRLEESPLAVHPPAEAAVPGAVPPLTQSAGHLCSLC